MQRRWISALAVLAGLTAALPPPTARAQSQSGPLRIIAPLAPGSTFDLLARALGTRFEQRTGQTVIVENRVGANMGLAANACKSAAPDGQTVCLFTHNLFLNPLIKSQLSYDPIKDLEPVALVSFLEQVFVVGRRLPVGTFAELVKYSKEHPDTLNYGSVGVGSAAHLVIEWLLIKSGGDWKHIPYNGAPKVQAALAAGDIHMTFTPSGNVMGRISSGDLKALLTAGEKRNPLLANVPTFAEAGLPALPAKSWAGLFVPTGTPDNIAARLHREFSAIAGDNAFQDQQLRKLGLAPARMSRSEFKTFVAADQRAWEPLIKQTGIQPN